MKKLAVTNLLDLAFYLQPHERQIAEISAMAGSTRVPSVEVSQRILMYCQSIALRAGLLRLSGHHCVNHLRNGAKPEKPGESVRVGYRYEDKGHDLVQRSVEEFFNIGTSDGRIQGYYSQKSRTPEGGTKTSIEELHFEAAVERSPHKKAFDSNQCNLDIITFHDQRVTDMQIRNGSAPKGIITYPEKSIEDIYFLEQHALLAVYIAELAQRCKIDAALTQVDTYNALFEVEGQPVMLSFGNPSTIEYIVGMRDVDEPEYANALGLNRDTIISQTYRSPRSNDFDTHALDAVEHMLAFMDRVATYQRAVCAHSPVLDLLR